MLHSKRPDIVKKILLIFVSLRVVLVLGFYIFVQVSWDKKYDWAGPSLRSTTDSTTIARGKYLVNGPAHCSSCHISGFADMMDSNKGKAVRSLTSTFKPIEKPDAPAIAPPMAATIERGEYLVKYVTNCVGCHTA